MYKWEKHCRDNHMSMADLSFICKVSTANLYNWSSRRSKPTMKAALDFYHAIKKHCEWEIPFDEFWSWIPEDSAND